MFSVTLSRKLSTLFKEKYAQEIGYEAHFLFDPVASSIPLQCPIGRLHTRVRERPDECFAYAVQNIGSRHGALILVKSKG